MAKLIAFYSRADENYFDGAYRFIPVGNTERAAKMLAELTGADLFKIEQKTPYAAGYQQCIAEAKRDLQANARPELVNLPEDLDGYDEIYLGYPQLLGYHAHGGVHLSGALRFYRQSDPSLLYPRGQRAFPYRKRYCRRCQRLHGKTGTCHPRQRGGQCHENAEGVGLRWNTKKDTFTN